MPACREHTDSESVAQAEGNHTHRLQKEPKTNLPEEFLLFVSSVSFVSLSPSFFLS